jgi:acyl phosphate:glycerol-3-phosphate acyltransferase
VLSRIVSLSSIISTICLPVAAVIFKQSWIIASASAVLAFFVLLRHKSNIVRLLQGRETQLSFHKKA